MKECEKCERLVNVTDLKSVDGKMVCTQCQTVKQLN